MFLVEQKHSDRLLVVKTSGTQSTRVATTDRNGRFELVGIERGTYDFKDLVTQAVRIRTISCRASPIISRSQPRLVVTSCS